jgi:hypothetical protein
MADGSCIRLRPERTQVSDAQRAQRVHSRMLGDPCRPQAQGDRCDRYSVRPLHPAWAFPLTSAPTTDRSSWPRTCRNGSELSAPRPLTSSGAVLGRTATSRASTRVFAMSCSTVRASTLYARPRSSSRAGDATTTQPGAHASLGYKPPAPEVLVPAFAALPAALRRPAGAAHTVAAQRVNHQ